MNRGLMCQKVACSTTNLPPTHPFVVPSQPSISFGKGDVLVASSGCAVKTVAMVVQFRTMCDRMMLFSQFKDGTDQDYALRVWKFGINRNAIRNGLNQNDWCVLMREVRMYSPPLLSE